jgi:membrane fusion protein (multidrug efflux system)
MTVSFLALYCNKQGGQCLSHVGTKGTGTVLIRQVQNDAIVVPQRATFQVLDQRYVYVVDEDDVAHRREIVVQNELDDLFVVKSGVHVDDKIVLDGIPQIRDGEKLEYKNRQSKAVVAN